MTMEDKQKARVLLTYPGESGLDRNIAIQGKPEGKGKKQRPTKLYLFLLICLLLSGVGTGISLLAYQAYSPLYHKDLSLAQVGIQHLRNATTLLQALPKKPLDASAVTHARQEFSAASSTFGQVNNSLQSLPGALTLVPVYGSRLGTALRLLPMAIEVSQAGMAGCTILNLLISRFHDPLNARSTGLTMADIRVITNNFRQIKSILNVAVGQVNQLQPEDVQFDPRLAKIISTFHASMPALQAELDDLDGLLASAPTLLGIGTPAHYLIEMLDSTELRPGGGFIGNYGIATFAGGRLSDAHITDTYLLDQAYRASGHTIPYPATYTWFKQHLSFASWSFRDSNLEADFPTSAQMGELNYKREGGSVPVQGVIAITPALIQHMFTITGPIYIPEYHETVTAQNLIDRIHYHQVGPGREGNDVPAADGRSSVRKRFTALLAEHFIARVHQLSSSRLSAFLPLMISSLRSKDIQIYLNANKAEDLLQQLHLSSAIQAPANDSIFVVNANISGDKANAFITNTLADQVTIDENGTAIHSTTIRYVWQSTRNFYGAPIYQDYMRVYIPPGSIVSMQHGWQPYGASMAFGREVIAGYFTFRAHQTVTINLVWKVPHAAKNDGQSWHYQYEVQRQAGAQWNLDLQVNLPSCAGEKSTLGGLAFHNNKAAMLNQVLNEDLLTGIDYAC